MLSHAQKFIKDESLAEDIIQDVALKLFKSKNIPENIDELKRFTLTAIKNKAIDYLRKIKTLKETNFNPELHFKSYSATPHNNEEILDYIETCLESIPLIQKQAISLHYLNELKYELVGEIMNTTSETARHHCRNGRKNLKKIMENK